MAIDARSLRHVLALAEARSYGKAAAALHLSEPALSRSITRLESRLGVRLFDRGRQGVTPTSFGRLVVDRGRGLIDGFEDLAREIALMQGLDAGELNVAAGLYPAEMSVGTAIGRLSVAHPALRISLRATTWREAAAAAVAGAVDVAVVELSALEGMTHMALEPLPRHPACFVCRPGHPLLAEPQLSLRKVLSFPLAGPPLPPRIGAQLRAELSGPRPEPPGADVTPPLQIESLALARRIVVAGNAVAILPHVLVAADLRDGALAALPLRPPWLHTGYGFAYRRDRTLAPAVLAFMHEVRAAEAALAATGAVATQPRERRPAGGRRTA